MPSVDYAYRCTVVDVLDGDTVRVDIDLGFELTARKSIRVFGINAPEIHGQQAKHGLAAKAFALTLLPIGSVVPVRTSKAANSEEEDKFGRWLATIALPDGRDFAATMIGQGMAAPWDGQGPKPVPPSHKSEHSLKDFS